MLDDSEFDYRVIRFAAVRVDGWEETFAYRMWLNFEGLVISRKTARTLAKRMENTCNTINRRFVEDGIITDPDEVREALDHNFIRPDCA